MVLKNKEELNKLTSYDEVMKYRRDVLRSDCPVWREYTEELELYMDIRFKEVVIKGFDDYREKVKNPKIDPWDRSAMTLILRLQPDNESLYKFFTEGKLKLLAPFKYIQL